jgi:putative transposase
MFRYGNSPLGQAGCWRVQFSTAADTDIFVRPVFKQIIVESLNHFIEKKGLVLFGWCLMSHCLDVLAQAEPGRDFLSILDELKKFTARIILDDMETEPLHRRAWIMRNFESSNGLFGCINRRQVWQTNPTLSFIPVNDPESMNEYLDHLHQIPVASRIVSRPEEYLHSSAKDYSGARGLVNVRLLHEEYSHGVSLHTRSALKSWPTL